MEQLGEEGDGFLEETSKIKHLMNLSFFRCGFPEHVRELGNNVQARFQFVTQS